MIKMEALKMIKINVDTLDKNSPIPLYFQLEEILKERIEAGELQARRFTVFGKRII